MMITVNIISRQRSHFTIKYHRIIKLAHAKFSTLNDKLDSLAQTLVSQLDTPTAIFLIRALKTIHSKPTDRTLILARITTRLGHDYKWFTKWLWHIPLDSRYSYSDTIPTNFELPTPALCFRSMNEESKEKLTEGLKAVHRFQSFSMLSNQNADSSSLDAPRASLSEGEQRTIHETVEFILQAATPDIVKGIATLIEDYALEILSAEQLAVALKRVCLMNTDVILRVLGHLKIPVHWKLNKDLKARQAVISYRAVELSDEIRHYIENRELWRERESGSGGRPQADHNHKRHWMPSHCHQSSVTCVLPLHPTPSLDVDAISRSSVIPLSPRTLFVTGLPDDVTEEDLTSAFSRCGEVEACVIRRTGVAEGIEYAVTQKPSKPTKEENVASGRTRRKSKEAPSEAPSSPSSPSSAPPAGGNPIADFTALSKAASDMDDEVPPAVVAKARAAVAKLKLKKSLLRQPAPPDNHAFVVMSSDEAMRLALQDDTRIFGICIKNRLCTVGRAADMRTLFVYVRRSLDNRAIQEYLLSVLGPDSLVEVAGDPAAKPVFLHLEFRSHWEAAVAFNVLEAAQKQVHQDRSLKRTIEFPLAPSWVRSNWYWLVAEKAKEMEQNATNILLQDEILSRVDVDGDTDTDTDESGDDVDVDGDPQALRGRRSPGGLDPDSGELLLVEPAEVDLLDTTEEEGHAFSLEREAL